MMEGTTQQLLTTPAHIIVSQSNVITTFRQANVILNDRVSLPPTVRNSLSLPTSNSTEAKHIFVCTFCQVFSSSDTEVANHIAEKHGESLLEGTSPKNFVSKLQALNSCKDNARNVGRPRKSGSMSSDSDQHIPAKKPTLIPTKAADGLYWCKKCYRHFQKPRQFSVHICLPTNNQDEIIADLENDDDDDDITSDFKISMHVEKFPWSKRKKSKTENTVTEKRKSSDDSLKDIQEKVFKPTLYWRNDPSYISLFNSESEKKTFEKHLKDIDYSCVDSLFEELGKKSKVVLNIKRKPGSNVKYSCVICRKIFGSLTHIRMHCLTHTDLKPFTCPKCSYRCNIKASLYTHMRTHTGNVFHCSLCSFQSTKRSHLIDHELTHSSVPMCCKLCKNMYKNLKSLIYHVKKYHTSAGGKKYIKSLSSKQFNKTVIKCDICEKPFTSNSNFESHKKYFHSINNNIEQLNSQNVSEKGSENSIDNGNLSDHQISSDTSVNRQAEAILNKEYNVLEPKNSFNDNSSSLEHFLELNPPVDSTSSASQNNPENTLLSSDVASFEKLPLLLDCSVMLEPLADHLVNYHQCNFKCTVCNESFSSKAILENHEILEHSSNVSSEQLKTQEINENIPENTGFLDSTALSSLSKCSVRIEPLDDHLVGLMLNDLLQPKSDQNLELFDNVFQQAAPQNILDSNTILNETVSSTNCPEKLLPINNESSVSDKQLETLGINQNNSSNTFEDIGFSDRPALSSLLNCSVRIEPLDNQLAGLMLNNLLQQKNVQNELFDGIFQQSEPQNIINTDAILNKTVSPTNTTPEKLMSISPEAVLENQKISPQSSSISADQLKTQENNQNDSKNMFGDIDFADTPALSSFSNCSVRIEPLDDQLVALLLNNLLQPKNSQNVEIFDDVFQQSKSKNILNSDTVLNQTLPSSTTPEKLLPMNDVGDFRLANTSVVEDRHNKLDGLDECIRQSTIADEVITETYQATNSTDFPHMTKASTAFDTPEMPLNFVNNQLILQPVSENSNVFSKNDLQVDSEQKSEEIKLFEKCRKAPAYVCCVCSSIFICTSTLKAHLKEHVKTNTFQTSLSDEYPIKDFKSEELITNHSSINNVCSILQGSSNSDVENELEKLYTSSLHKRWYLPEVSVVLENDQSLIDAFLDEFPINDKFDEPESLQLESVIFS